MEKIAFKKLSPGARVPVRMSEGASGYDAVACLEQPLVLEPQARCLVPLGFAVAIPRGFEIQVRPRSGLALNKGVTVLNSPGTIDSDYRGEVKVMLINLGERPVCIEAGERVAQLVLQRVETFEWEETAELAPTQRGTGGFGSTGTHLT